jgi:hypothetical protein
VETTVSLTRSFSPEFNHPFYREDFLRALYRGILGVLRQGQPSMAEHGTHPTCAYRGKPDAGGKPLMCAIGQIMPNTTYGTQLENKPVTDIEVQMAAFGRELTQEEEDLAQDVQNAHDQAAYAMNRVRNIEKREPTIEDFNTEVRGRLPSLFARHLPHSL